MMMPCDTRRYTLVGGHVNNGHVVNTRHHEHPPTRHIPGCWLLERNKTIPTSSFSIFPCPCPENWRRKNIAPPVFPVLVFSRPTSSTTDRQRKILSASPHLSPPPPIPAARRREASHPQPTTLLAFSLGASQPLTPQQQQHCPRRGALVSMMAWPARVAKRPPPRYHDIFWGRDGGVAGDIYHGLSETTPRLAWDGDLNHQTPVLRPLQLCRWMPGTGDADSLQDLLAFRRRRHITAFSSRHVHRPVPSLTSSSDSKRRVSSAPLPRRHPPPRRGRRRRRRT